MKYKKVLNQDLKLAKLVSLIPTSKINRIEGLGNVREYLIQCIVSQQLSIKVAPIIFQRFLDLFGNKFPSNSILLDTSIETLRACGLSNQKASYILNIARYFHDNKLKDSTLNGLDDEQVIEELTKIKGVGRWTVEMVLMFCMGREDVFSTGDYGIQVAMKDIYNIKKEKKELEKKMHQIAEKWKPYRSYACMYLWAYKDLNVKK
ncbi:MAG: DNA-3-methyladenine glycosylase 2 family protein [Saprospiraceae bacterium]|nr:DNA-3-methyladenine glycosylase 2 family protein [Saprospiraceae bacterium]